MQQAFELPTPWHTGPFRGRTRGLLFGAMYEDSSIELEAFAPFSRVFCIASAGCTARDLSAAGHDVTAVDINPQQVSYAQARAAGGPICEGAVDGLLSRGRMLLPLLGWTEVRRHQFLSMHDSCEQLYYWQQTLNTKRWRLAMDSVLSAAMLGLVYTSPFVAGLPRHFGAVMRARLERTWKTHSNHSNPYAWRLLTGETRMKQRPTPAIRFACADAAIYLEGCKPASFDAFSLSNITDGVPSRYVQRLSQAVRHAGATGATVVTRSFAEPATVIDDNLAALDRSMLWGTVRVTRAADLCSTF